MKKLLAGGVASIALAACAAHASTFEFSYTFDTNQVVTGTFEGTGPVTDVTDITNIHVTVDGTALTGPLFAYFHTDADNGVCGDPSCYLGTGATASSNSLANNFVFANGTATDISTRTNYFYIIPWNNGPGNQVASQALVDGNLIDPYNGNYNAASWSLVAVPEPATWAMMLLGVGGLGASLRSRRRVSFAAA